MNHKANPKQRINVVGFVRENATGSFICHCADNQRNRLHSRTVTMTDVIMESKVDKDGYVPQVLEEWDDSINDIRAHHYSIPFYEWFTGHSDSDMEFLLQKIINRREGRTEGVAAVSLDKLNLESAIPSLIATI